jgi:hypothetical protein
MVLINKYKGLGPTPLIEEIPKSKVLKIIQVNIVVWQSPFSLLLRIFLLKFTIACEKID